VTARRWPLEPLAALMGGRPGLTARGIDTRQITRAEADGLSDLLADRWAVRCGLHPYTVWPDMADAAVADIEQECEADDCTARFVPSPRAHAGRHRFCSRRCADRVYQRRRRQRPEVRQANREARRAYYAAHGDYERARERRRRHARPLSEFNQKK
jgi:hypothetical protein